MQQQPLQSNQQRSAFSNITNTYLNQQANISQKGVLTLQSQPSFENLQLDYDSPSSLLKLSNKAQSFKQALQGASTGVAMPSIVDTDREEINVNTALFLRTPKGLERAGDENFNSQQKQPTVGCENVRMNVSPFFERKWADWHTHLPYTYRLIRFIA